MKQRVQVHVCEQATPADMTEFSALFDKGS